MNKTKYERYMPMILSFKKRAKSYGLDDKVKLADDLLKELKGQEENFDETKLEVLNYATFKVDKEIKIKKYISEDITEFEQAYIDAYEGKDVLAISPTGSGKAYSSNQIVKKHNMPILNLLPNASITNQQENEYQIMSAYGKIKEDATKSLEYCLEKSKIVGATWNKLSDLSRNEAMLKANMAKLNERVLSLDEAHEQFSNGFRADRAEDINKLSQSGIFKGTISMTGTPNRLDFSKYDKIIKYVSDDNIDYKVFVYDTVSNDFIINEINNNVKGRFAIFEDNVTNLTYLDSQINAKTDVVYAENKEESQVYKNIMNRGTLGKYKGVLHTSTMLAGVNIKDKDVTDVFITGTKDPAKIKQICARYREVKELNIHIFNKYPKVQSDFCYIESRIEYITKRRYEEVLKLNQDIIELGLDYVVGANECHIKDGDETIYFDKATSRYRVNEVAIRTKQYDSYYEQRSRNQFEVLLKEYFTNVNIVNLNVEKENKEEKAQFIEKMEAEAKAIIDSLEPYKDVLVLCNRICKGLKLTKDQEIYLLNNGLNVEDLRTTYNTLGIDKLLDNLLFKTHNILYTDLVTDRHFDKALAWSLASLTESEVKKLDGKIKMLNYLYEREHNYDNMMTKAKMLIEHQRVEYILSLDLENTWLNKEHFELILNDYKKFNSRDIKVKSVHLKSIIEDMYNIVRSNATPDSNFYNDLVPDFKGKKKIKAYNCKEKTTLADVANQLNVDTDNKTLNDLVIGKKSL